MCRELRDVHLVVDRTDLAFGDFGLDQLLEQIVRLLERGRTLLGKLSHRTGHAVQLHGLQCGHKGVS